MCIAFFTLTLPGYKLVLASNRDEFLDRPTLPAQWHDFTPGGEAENRSTDGDRGGTQVEGKPKGSVLSGLDRGKQEGGTWLGITQDLRVGLLTNVRLTPPTPPLKPSPNPPSRGLLLKQFLLPSPTAGVSVGVGVHEYLTSHLPTAGEYEGFNLLLFSLGKKGEEAEVGYLTNRPKPSFTELRVPDSTSTSASGADGASQPVGITAQCFGISNSPMYEPWPKVIEGEKRMAQTLKEWADVDGRGDEKALVERMFGVLGHQAPITEAGDLSTTTTVPHLIVPGESPNNKARGYGTRTATVILVREDGKTTFVERDVLVLDELHGEVKKGERERWFEFQAEV
ncbi:hypothetical protein CI109_102655 [Kwoniella shandongensis]|uniref:Uncharacterized protein n=1 Tax=Kwoniella shandongensis TaxID=1734106 RepID=A0A5M6BYE3_9TREE|nr:uncharacterized protein CI109_005235 [Kwoniella shandongensis]KAA5526465.1 hypothetical protein CI109_005235 [Kwoniella shandongensis]